MPNLIRSAKITCCCCGHRFLFLLFVVIFLLCVKCSHNNSNNVSNKNEFEALKDLLTFAYVRFLLWNKSQDKSYVKQAIHYIKTWVNSFKTFKRRSMFAVANLFVFVPSKPTKILMKLSQARNRGKHKWILIKVDELLRILLSTLYGLFTTSCNWSLHTMLTWKFRFYCRLTLRAKSEIIYLAENRTF